MGPVKCQAEENRPEDIKSTKNYPQNYLCKFAKNKHVD